MVVLHGDNTIQILVCGTPHIFTILHSFPCHYNTSITVHINNNT